MNHKTLKDTVIAWDMACKRPTPTGAQIAEKADAFYPPEQREKDLKAIRTQIARLGEIIGYHSEQEEPL